MEMVHHQGRKTVLGKFHRNVLIGFFSLFFGQENFFGLIMVSSYWFTKMIRIQPSVTMNSHTEVCANVPCSCFKGYFNGFVLCFLKLGGLSRHNNKEEKGKKE